ncbi:MAG: hypothetical protein FD146_842 [Anaerolineaceae bacterium]|nr:MAG: hypothetical protein FD146_842 [Anaerolineaceae bacterium]
MERWDIIAVMPALLTPSLADRLRSLGVRPASDLKPAPDKPAGAPIQSVVDGRFVPARGGETFVAEQVFAADYRHGVAPIFPFSPLPLVAAWARDSRLSVLDPSSFVFLDTETSGLAGGTGTYAFLVGAGRFEGGEFRLQQFFMRDPAEESSMLEALAEFLAPCRALVTFNGKAFDAPLLVTRYSLHSIPLPFKDFAHLDLLPLARRLWRDRLPSRALKYIEENVLMAPRTAEEVPGYEIPYLYFDYLRTGDAAPLKGVFYHNAMDVVAMAALLRHAAHMLADPLGESIEHGLDRVALAKLFEDLGKWETAARLYERGLEQSLPEADFWQAVKRLSLLQRRRGDLESAVHLWEKAAAAGHVYAFVELAKYCEHHARDASAALEWTRKAMERAGELDIPRYEYNHWVQELEHRRERLEGKAGRESG